MSDKSLVSSMKYEGHVTTPTRPTVSTADETRNQPSFFLDAMSGFKLKYLNSYHI